MNATALNVCHCGEDCRRTLLCTSGTTAIANGRVLALRMKITPSCISCGMISARWRVAWAPKKIGDRQGLRGRTGGSRSEQVSSKLFANMVACGANVKREKGENGFELTTTQAQKTTDEFGEWAVEAGFGRARPAGRRQLNGR